MNIVNKVTIRHLKQNKRRTLVTVIGVIISAAMIMAVATLGVSFLDLLKRQTIATEGEWHVLYNDVNPKQLEAIKNDEETKELVVSKSIGFASLKGSKNENKPYLYIKAYNDQGFTQFPIELIDGRLPKTENEVVLSEEIAKNAHVHYKIGDQLTFNVGERQATEQGNLLVLSQTNPLQMENGKIVETLVEKTTASYTVVGFVKSPIWEPTWAPGYSIFTHIDEGALSPDDTVDVSVVLKKVNRSLYAHAEKLANENQIHSFYFNNGLLRYYGITNNDNLHATLFGLSAVIMTVIIVGSVSLIYNAFAISVSERSRHLGMLSSVGATKRQKRNSVFFEGFIIGLISIPIGLLAGIAGLSITFYFINSIIQGALGVTEKLEVTITPLTIVIACCVSIITIFISTYIPAARASRVSAIDAIRQSMDVKLTSKAVKTSKLVRKLFGFEAEIGLKNLKRNKRRYQATVFSLVISIVLFLAVSFFTENLKKSLVLSQDGINYDIQITMYNGMTQANERQLHSFAELENVTDSSFIKTVNARAWIEEAAIADKLKNDIQNDQTILKDGRYPYDIMIHALDNKSLKAYAKDIGVNYDQLINTRQLKCIVIDTIPYKDNEAGKYTEIKAIHKNIGQSIELHYVDMDTNTEKDLNKVMIAGLTDQHPMGIFSSGVGGLNIIVSEEVLKNIIGNNGIADHYASLYLKSKDPMKTQQEIEEMKENEMNVQNIYLGRQQEEQLMMIMSVFTYGFIVLITAISMANIFNTISTSISLRKREFGMLKSVGMTPKGFNKMINYESIFYGIKSLLYGLPISIAVMYMIHRSLMNSFSYTFTLPLGSIIYVVVAVFIIVGSAMLYSSSKVKRENIIDALKQENI
ncbi:FtsX-like permease family protein [Bacillus sp. S/N-304-OC-R1]|uniref:ABC transporter permease n=1 Tax=Bacillus sp. S/N-304-OC-R1 TaxID=2758034 RepID=UPI001C8E531A|nr:FtsX-like permease family protein [Bacillus sp. S/N-304-OC-R1]MBY0122028.1 FtsX-like permease family protein [Bacillus sp. S/N-304-OC-R1]